MSDDGGGAEATRGKTSRRETLEQLYATTERIALQARDLREVAAALAEAERDRPLTEVEHALVRICRGHADDILVAFAAANATFVALTTGRN